MSLSKIKYEVVHSLDLMHRGRYIPAYLRLKEVLKMIDTERDKSA